MTPRGIRNNNPGNVVRDGTKWQGMADDQSSDPRFIVFKTAQYGIRALAKVLLSYQTQHGLKTIRAMIGRWAPPNENNTSAYVDAVASACEVSPDAEVDVDTTAVMKPLVCAVIQHENGVQPYSDAVIGEALRLAGIADAKPPPLVKQGGFLARAGGAATVAVSTAVQYQPQVKGWADQLADYTGVPVLAHAHQILLGAAGALLVLGMGLEIMKHRSAA